MVKFGFVSYKNVWVFFRLLLEKWNGTKVLAEEELKVSLAGMCLLTLINGQFCDNTFIHTEGSKKQINKEAVVTMPKKRWLMKNMVEVQSAMLYECSFIQHPRNKYSSNGERTLPWNVVEVRQNLIRPHASKINSSHPRIKFKSSWAQSMQAAPLLHYAWFWHLVTWATF